MVIEGGHHVGVEAQHVAVTDAVGDAVSVQAFAEHHSRGRPLLLILVEDWRSRETEEEGIGEGAAYVLEHVAEGGSVALINDKYDTLAGQAVELGLGDSRLTGLQVAHLLDRGNDKAILGVVTGELGLEDLRVLSALHVVGVVGEGAILRERLRAQLDAIHEEHDLVGIMRVGDKLSRFKAGHGFAGAGGVPDIAARATWRATVPWLIPFASADLVRDGRGGVVLVAAHDF